MSDPTYDQTQIKAKPACGWGKYIWVAECLLANYEIKRKASPDRLGI